MTCRIWAIFLLPALFFLAGVLAGCAPAPKDANPPVAAETAPVGNPSQVVHCQSPVDGWELSGRVLLPEGYDNSHERALVVVLPGTPFPENPLLGQALVALLEDSRPAKCPDAIRQEDYQGMVKFLLENFPVNRQRVFLAGGSASHLAFACANASSFAGVYFCFPDGVPFEDPGTILRNLLNLPVYLDNSRCASASPISTALSERLRTAGATRLNAPEVLLGGTDPRTIVAAAFSWLAANVSEDNRIVWEARDPSHGECRWLRMDEFLHPWENGVFSAEESRTPEGWRRLCVHTRNLRAFSVQTGVEGSGAERKPLFLEVDGAFFSVTSGHGWIRLRHDNVGEKWHVQTGHDEKPGCSVYLEDFLLRPCLLVVGTAQPERAGLWRESAERCADAWGDLTGVRPVIRLDTGVTEEDLAGRELILFGSPADNRMTETILEENPSFLRNLFLRLEEEKRTDDMLAVMTLCPQTILPSGHQAMVILANGSQAIPGCWKPLLENLPARVDFMLSLPGEMSAGHYHSDWTIP